jgi:uncharacterized protein YjdB
MNTRLRRLAVSLFCLGLSTLFAVIGCSNKHLVSIAVTPQNASVSAIGQTTQFQAMGTTNHNLPPELLSTVTWSSSNSSVATISSTGLATAVGCGTTTISAQDGSIVGQTGFTNTCLGGGGGPPVLQSITLFPSNPTIPQVTETAQFIALGVYSPPSSNTDLTSLVTWASSNVAIAMFETPDSPSRATAVGCGTTTITAEYQGVVGQTQLTVSCTVPPPPVLQSITLFPSNPTIPQVGQTVPLTALAVYSPPQSNNNITTTATWASSNPGVATIGINTGVATAVSCGTTTIQAEFMGVVGQTTLTVSCPALQSINVFPSNPTIPQVGQAVPLIALAVYSPPQSNNNITTAATWVSSNQGVATIGINTGIATAVSCGTTTIQAVFMGVVGQTLLTVPCTTPVLQSITLFPSNPTIPQVSETAQFIALGVSSPPTNNNDLTSVATWASSNVDIATMSPSIPGQATAVNCGTTTITAEYQGVIGQTLLTVPCTSPILQSLTVLPSNPTVPQIGQTSQFVALGTVNGVQTDLTSTVTWSSSNVDIATIDSPGLAGLATTVSCGTTTISAEYQSVVAQTLLTVSCTSAVSIELLVVKTGSVNNTTVISAPAGISCGTLCGALFNAGTGVTLTATPVPTSWANCDQVLPGGSACFITLRPDTPGAQVTVTANF